MTYNPPVTTPQSKDTVIIKDYKHTPTWCEPRLRDGALIGRGQNRLYLSSTEIDRLIDALTEPAGQANRAVYSTSTPAKAQMARWVEPQPGES
jgi:hypothetical protein